jgi:hypothetical protein
MFGKADEAGRGWTRLEASRLEARRKQGSRADPLKL